MKKLYAILAGVLMSASLLAAPATVPTVSDLANAGYDATNQVVLCLYFDEEVCNQIALVGSYAADDEGNWFDDPAKLKKFAALDGFEGWYAVEFDFMEGESDGHPKCQAKAVQLQSDGTFSWNYQTGDPDAWIHKGGNEADIWAGFDSEANVGYASKGAYIYEIAYFKKHQSPCVPQIKHNYTILVYAPDACPEMKPSVIGDFPGNSWNTSIEMTEDMDASFKKVYKLTIEAAEGTEYQIKEASDTDWSNRIQHYDAESDNWITYNWNWTLPDTTDALVDVTVIHDYADNETNRWEKCQDSEDVVVAIKLPYAPEAGVDIIGTFDGWAGTEMELVEGLWGTMIQANASQFFKIRQHGSWDNQLMYLNDESEWVNFEDGDLTFGALWEDGTGAAAGYKVVYLDFSDPAKYKWTWAEGIENVVLTEKVNKVIIDGQLYIIRDNKMYNAQGTQVR